MKCFSSLILREVLLAFNKNPLGIFKCEHMKKLGGFMQRVSQSRLTRLATFNALSKQF
jgi:hypothetical protein